MNSTDGGVTWNSDYRVTDQPWPVNTGPYGVDIDEGYTHIVFIDNRTADSDREVYYKRNPDFASPIPEFSNLLIPVLTVLIMIPALQYYINRKGGE